MRIIYLIYFLTCSNILLGQKANLSNYYGKRYVNQQGDYFELLNEKVLLTNLHGYGDSANYWVSSDTIYSKQEYEFSQADKKGTEVITHYFIVKTFDANKVDMEGYGFHDRNYHKEKVNFTFYSSTLLETEVKNFDYCIIEYLGPFWGYSKLKVSKNGQLEFFYDTHSLIFNYSQIDTTKTKGWKTGKLTKVELNSFIRALKRANIQGQVINRNERVLDRHNMNFTLKLNSKIYYSLGNKILPQQTEIVNLYYEFLKRFIVYEI